MPLHSTPFIAARQDDRPFRASSSGPPCPQNTKIPYRSRDQDVERCSDRNGGGGRASGKGARGNGLMLKNWRTRRDSNHIPQAAAPARPRRNIRILMFVYSVLISARRR